MTSENATGIGNPEHVQNPGIIRYAAALSLAAIFLHLLSRYLLHSRAAISSAPLWVAIVAGGLPLFYKLLLQIWKRQFGADLLAGLSIITAVLMNELLVATIIVLMQRIAPGAVNCGPQFFDYAARKCDSTASGKACSESYNPTC